MCFKAEARERGLARYRAGGELGAVGRPAQGPACSPAARAPVASTIWRFAKDAAQAELVGALEAQGLHPTEQINRCYFRSVYFREPGGVLLEIATDAPRLHRRRAERDPGQRDQAAALV